MSLLGERWAHGGDSTSVGLVAELFGAAKDKGLGMPVLGRSGVDSQSVELMGERRDEVFGLSELLNLLTRADTNLLHVELGVGVGKRQSTGSTLPSSCRSM